MNKTLSVVTIIVTITALGALIAPSGLTAVFAGNGTPNVTTTIDSVKLNKAGVVTVTFTVVCEEGAGSGTITRDDVSVKQTTGRFGGKVVSGSAGSGAPIDHPYNCSPANEGGGPVTLTETVVADSGFFVSGRATVEATATVCNDDGPDFSLQCDTDSGEQAVKLRAS